MSEPAQAGGEDAAFALWRDAVSIDRQGERADGQDIAGGGTVSARWVRRVALDHAEGRHRIFSGLRIPDTIFTDDLHLENLDLPFPLFFEHCIFDGVVSAWGIKGKTFGFENCTLRSGADMRNTEIDGHLLMRGGFIAEGPLILRDMTVKGTIDFRGAQLLYDGVAANPLRDAAEGECVGLSRTNAIGFFWGATAGPTKEAPCAVGTHRRPAAKVTLRDMQVKSFRHDLAACGLAAWPTPGNLILEGFSYERMDACPSGTAEAWLALQPEATPSALFALASSFDRQGQREQSERLRAQIKRIEIDRYPPVRRALSRVAFAAIDYGASPMKALALALLAFLLFLTCVWSLDRTGKMTPAVDAQLLETCRYGLDRRCVKVVTRWRRTGADDLVARYMPPDYPTLSPILYSVESFVPPLDFGQRRYWQPVSDNVGLALSLLALTGMFLGGLCLAALTGLLAPKER